MKAVLEVIAAKFGNLVRNQLLSIILPGAVVVLEVWTLADFPLLAADTPVSSIPYPQVVAAVLLIYISYIVGFCCRQLSFFVAEGGLRPLVFWLPRRRPTSVLPYKTTRWGEVYYCRESFEHNMNLLRSTFGPEWVRNVVRRHPLRVLDNSAAPAASGIDQVDFREVFHYCKHWLLANYPGLGTVAIEIEFNLQFSVFIPLALVPFVALKLSGDIVVFVLSALLAGTIAYSLYRRGNHLRHAEVFNVLRNVMFADWYSRTALKIGEPVGGEASATAPGKGG